MSDLFDRYRPAVEAALREALACPEPAFEPLYGMMEYHLGWRDADLAPIEMRTGKRLRPLICLALCDCLGGDWRRAVPYATAIELVHNFSLIHDDIEDDSALRHDRPTLWRVWGLAQGINTGDALWCLARLALLGLSAAGHGAATVLAAVALLDQACMALCQGQYLDIAHETHPTIGLDAYEQMARGKTAALLSAACQGGGLLAGAGPDTQDLLAALGQELGLAYQIVDDILGIWGDAALTGKSAESDIAARKKSFPVAYAFEWEAARGLSDLQRHYQLASSPAADAEIMGLLERAGARAYSRDCARQRHQAVRMLWARLGVQGAAATALEELFDALLTRDY